MSVDAPSPCPAARDDVVFRALGGEWLLYDPRSRLLHVLNLSAAVVWSLCDGTHDEAAMVRAVLSGFEDPPDEATAREQVRGTLDRFRAEELLK